MNSPLLFSSRFPFASLARRSVFQKTRAGVCWIVAFACFCHPAVAENVHDHDNHDHDRIEAPSSAQLPTTEENAHETHSNALVETHENAHPRAPRADEEEHEDLVRITPEVMAEFGITLAKAGPGLLQETVTLPGEIQFNSEAVAHTTPKFDGTVLSIEARLADPVVAGQVLARMENADNLRPFEIKAPFNGVVVTYDITLGETIAAGTPVFTIANLSTVWADIQIYQKDLAHVHKGQKVEITGSHDSPTFHGTVAYIAPTIDEHTRTGLARIVVANSEGKWKPGQFITGVFTIEEHPVDLCIPRSAVLEYEGEKVVFVQTEEGMIPRPIKLGHWDRDHFEVLSGLMAGESYVTRNAISLKAELGKSSFGGHEGHVH